MDSSGQPTGQTPISFRRRTSSCGLFDNRNFLINGLEVIKSSLRTANKSSNTERNGTEFASLVFFFPLSPFQDEVSLADTSGRIRSRSTKSPLENRSGEIIKTTGVT